VTSPPAPGNDFPNILKFVIYANKYQMSSKKFGDLTLLLLTQIEQ